MSEQTVDHYVVTQEVRYEGMDMTTAELQSAIEAGDWDHGRNEVLSDRVQAFAADGSLLYDSREDES